MPAPDSLKNLLGPRCVETAERLQRYEIPERGAPGQASCVLLPESEEEIGALLRLCHEQGLSLVISAGRTGLVEAQRPEGEAVLSLERLSRALRLRLADGTTFEVPAGNAEAQGDALHAWWQGQGRPALGGATLLAQAGLPVDSLNTVLAPLGLMFPMEMGSSSAATVGACVANGSAGANAVCYGTAAHMCVQAWGYWGNGKPAGPCRAVAWSTPDPQALAINSALVRPDWGLIGAQGALGVITRVELRTYAIPAQREAVLLPAADMPAAMRVLDAARSAFPGAVEEFEFISALALERVRELKGDAFRAPLARLGSPWYLLLQVKSEAEDEDLAGRLYSFVSETLRYADEDIGYAPLKELKALRHSITEASNHRMKALGGGRLAFDTATPVAVFGEYLAALEQDLCARFPGMELIAFGHAGVGGAHLHVLGTRERPVQAHAAQIIDLVFDVTHRFGGTFSAEHGVGTKWGDEFARRVSPETLAALLEAKRRHDPRNVLNPRAFGLHRLLA